MNRLAGIIPNSSTGKTTAQLNADINVNDRLTVGGSIQYIQNKANNRPGTGYNVTPLEQFIWFGRQVDVTALKREQYDANGNLFNWNYSYHNNPYWLQYSNPENDERDRIIAGREWYVPVYVMAQGTRAFRYGHISPKRQHRLGAGQSGVGRSIIRWWFQPVELYVVRKYHQMEF